MEYGEVATEAVGRGIKLALRLINDLEINEQILYARMENVEESTLEGAIYRVRTISPATQRRLSASASRRICRPDDPLFKVS